MGESGQKTTEVFGNNEIATLVIQIPWESSELLVLWESFNHLYAIWSAFIAIGLTGLRAGSWEVFPGNGSLGNLFLALAGRLAVKDWPLLSGWPLMYWFVIWNRTTRDERVWLLACTSCRGTFTECISQDMGSIEWNRDPDFIVA